MTKIEKCIKRANYVLGYTKPTFTKEELELKYQLEEYESWTPTTERFKIEGDDIIELSFPKPEKPKLSAELVERIKMRKEWVNRFNWYYYNL